MEYTTIQKTAERWGVSKAHVHKLCQDGRIPGAKQVDQCWHIPEDAVYPLKAKKPTDENMERKIRYVSSFKMAEKWGTSNMFVCKAAREGLITGAKKGGSSGWRIPEDAEKPKFGKPGFLSATHMARKWGVRADSVMRLCELGQIPGVERDGEWWFIPEGVVYPLEGYISVPKMAEKWGMSRSAVWKFCDEGRIPSAKCVGRDWYIPADAKKPANKTSSRMPGYISASEMARKWGTPRKFVCEAAKDGCIPGAEQIDGKWHIPEDAVCPAKK